MKEELKGWTKDISESVKDEAKEIAKSIQYPPFNYASARCLSNYTLSPHPTGDHEAGTVFILQSQLIDFLSLEIPLVIIL